MGKTKKKIFIGTSGWNYRHWKGRFYPDDMPVKEWLKYYYQQFQTVELNSSFYHLPKKSVFETWNKTTPKGFLFAVKASRYITHVKRLLEPEEPAAKFFENLEGLGEKTGPVLFQLPPGLKFDLERLNNFLAVLPSRHEYTIEFRNKSWWNDQTYNVLQTNGIAFCIFELAGVITPIVSTSKFVYLRLHGPGGKYQGSYSEETLREWANKFLDWRKEGKRVYCYFDNDDSAYAAFNALSINKMIEDKESANV